MSLDNPTKFERVLNKFSSFPTAVRVGILLGIVVIVLGTLFFAADRISTWNANRKLRNAQIEANAALKELANAKAAVDPVGEAVALEKLKEATNTALEASAATDEAKAEANRALSNYKVARNANVPTGTTEADLLKKLEGLE